MTSASEPEVWGDLDCLWFLSVPGFIRGIHYVALTADTSSLTRVLSTMDQRSLESVALAIVLCTSFFYYKHHYVQ